MSAVVISLQDYRRKKEEERRLKNVRDLKARNYSEDYTFGPDDNGEDFGGHYPLPVSVEKELPEWLRKIMEKKDGDN